MPTDVFIIQPKLSSDSVFGQLHVQLCLSPIPDCQPTTTELSRSPPLGSGTVFLGTSHLHRHSPPSAFVSRHTVIIFVIRSTFVCACKVTSSFFGHVNHFYLLTYKVITLGALVEWDGVRRVCYRLNQKKSVFSLQDLNVVIESLLATSEGSEFRTGGAEYCC